MCRVEDKKDLILYFQGQDLLSRTANCTFCTKTMNLQKMLHNSNGYIFRFTKCSKTKGITYTGFFSNVRSPVNKITLSLITWLEKKPNKLSMVDSGIGKDTIGFLFDLIRSYCMRYFYQIPFKLGGTGTIVQIDESNFRHKPKYHKGRMPESELWVFGGIEY